MEDRIAEYRKWIGNYDRPSGPQTLVSPDGWRDALRWALDEYVRLREYTRDLEQTAQRETADLIRENARLREVAEQRKNKAKIARAGQQAMGQELARLREALEKIANYGNAVAGAQHTNVSWGRQQMADEARNAIKETT